MYTIRNFIRNIATARFDSILVYAGQPVINQASQYRIRLSDWMN